MSNFQPNPLQIFKLIFSHLISDYSLKRTPEPISFYNDIEKSLEYSKSQSTNMMIPYAIALNYIQRISTTEKINSALELCCGPGVFTQQLAKITKINHITAVDLSQTMLGLAKANCSSLTDHFDIQFKEMNILNLTTELKQKFNLITFLNGAHHLENLNDVKTVLQQAESLSTEDGIIFVLDPVRPKSDKIANYYINLFGKEYLVKGLNHFFNDFKDSMYASWTPTEMGSSIPENTNKQWIQLIPFGFPAFQILIGIPKNRKQLFLRNDLSISIFKDLLPSHTISDFNLLKTLFKIGLKVQLNPNTYNELEQYHTPIKPSSIKTLKHSHIDKVMS